MAKCRICGADARLTPQAKVTLVYNSEFDLVSCECCGGSYFDPLPSTAQLGEFYSGGYYDGFQDLKGETNGRFFIAKIKTARPHGKFLDVGCSTGAFLNGVKKYSDWDVFGVDFGEDAVRYAQDTLGLANVRQGQLTDAAYPDAFFDIVQINNVLEHVPDPLLLLRETRRIIKPGGVLYLNVPNGPNDSRCLLDFYNNTKLPARSPKGHIYFFSEASLTAMFQTVGFGIAKTETCGIKPGLRNAGLLPQKSNWQSAHYPPPRPEKGGAPRSAAKQPENAIKAAYWYQRYRYFCNNLSLPGLRSYGLDYKFTLTPVAPKE